MYSEKSEDYMNYYYIGTHIRYGPYLMGIMLGYLLFKLKKNGNYRVRLVSILYFRIYTLQGIKKKFFQNFLLVILLWSLALTVMLTVIFSSHGILFDYDVIAVSFYNGMHRHAWALGLCWIIFACTQGYGGNKYTTLAKLSGY